MKAKFDRVLATHGFSDNKLGGVSGGANVNTQSFGRFAPVGMTNQSVTPSSNLTG